MKVLVTGSRHWTNKVILWKALYDVEPDISIIVHGGAKGADTLASNFAKYFGIEERCYPAKWDLYGRSAGKNRNLEMLFKENLLDNPIDLVLAFPLPQSKGTYHMIRIADQAGIPVQLFDDPECFKETV